MKKQLIGFILPFLLCVLLPLGANVIYLGNTIIDMSSPPPGRPGSSFGFTVTVSEDGKPVSGQTVRFSVSPKDGTVSLSPTSATTDSGGQASTTLSTGSGSSGAYEVTATLPNGYLTSRTATVEGSSPPPDNTPPPPPPQDNTPPPPPPQDNQQQQQQQQQPLPESTSLEVVSGNNQSDLTGEALTNPFVVEVRDQYDDPMERVAVTFTVSAGGGSLSATSVNTDANGLAQSTLTLGSDPGTNTVEASVEGIAETKIFSAEATLPPPIPTTLSVVSGDNQSGMTGEALANPFVVEVRDQYGAPVAGVPVDFAVRAGGGSLSDTSVDTDANSLAQSTLTLGNDPGTNTVDVSVEGITETVTFNAVAELLEFDLSLPVGLSLIHVPLKVRTVEGEAQTIESVSDLYDALGGTDTVNYLITYDSETQNWYSYFGDADRGLVADRMLTDDTGILVSMKAPVSVRLGGDTLGVNGVSTITLQPSLNLVGLPLRDSRINRVSDLLRLDGIWGNVRIVTVTVNGYFRSVGWAGDPGDIEVTGGQSFILSAQEAATVTISGDAWDNTASGMMAAPSLMTGGSQMIGITPVLALSGSIVHGVRSTNSAGLRVTVKNLSTGSAVAARIEETGDTPSQVDYRLTVVDIAGGRAAAMGDTLEISVTSPDTSIGVEPLRYTVTTEDVRRSRIELPTLFLQEIPAETELLRNYPNPFNPETWIPYRLAKDAFVTLTIYDGSGQVVRTLDVGHQTAAVYENQSKAAYWNGRNNLGESVASGVYFYNLTADNFSATRKMLILK